MTEANFPGGGNSGNPSGMPMYAYACVYFSYTNILWATNEEEGPPPTVTTDLQGSCATRWHTECKERVKEGEIVAGFLSCAV